MLSHEKDVTLYAPYRWSQQKQNYRHLRNYTPDNKGWLYWKLYVILFFSITNENWWHFSNYSIKTSLEVSKQFTCSMGELRPTLFLLFNKIIKIYILYFLFYNCQIILIWHSKLTIIIFYLIVINLRVRWEYQFSFVEWILNRSIVFNTFHNNNVLSYKTYFI
jgi:hypothetical protein